ncbi:MAG: tetratricopeptide repeat protein [Planctomycetota bacterium]|jgi:superkiller protein 3|nr:tetratricopeptide repeat protein [Planctomycetota bacterium]
MDGAKDKNSTLGEASRLLAEGEIDRAAALVFAAWSGDRENLDLAVSYACLLARGGREAEAEDLFAALADESPGDARVWNNWGFLMLERGDVQGAIEKLGRALELVPDDFESLVNLGIALDRGGDAEGALAKYRRAVSLNPESPVAYNNMGAALWRGGRGGEALEAFRAALRLNPRDASAANNMGVIKMAEGDHAEAAAYFRQALEIDPAGTAAARNLKAAGRRARAAGKGKKKCRKPPSLF